MGLFSYPPVFFMIPQTQSITATGVDFEQTIVRCNVLSQHICSWFLKKDGDWYCSRVVKLDFEFRFKANCFYKPERQKCLNSAESHNKTLNQFFFFWFLPDLYPQTFFCPIAPWLRCIMTNGGERFFFEIWFSYWFLQIFYWIAEYFVRKSNFIDDIFKVLHNFFCDLFFILFIDAKGKWQCSVLKAIVKA